MTMNRTHVRIQVGGVQGGLRPGAGWQGNVAENATISCHLTGAGPRCESFGPPRAAGRGCGRYFEPVQALPTLVRLPRSTVTWLVAFTRPFASRQVRVQLSLVPVSIFGVGELNVTLPRLQSSGVFITWS